MHEASVVSAPSNVNSPIEFSIEAAKSWIEAMGERGKYQPDSARFRVTAITRLTAVMGPEEPNDARWLLENVEELGKRYGRKTNGNPDTIATYVSRAKVALSDFLKFQEDPTSFKGRSGPARSAKPKEEKKKAAAPIESNPELSSVVVPLAGPPPKLIVAPQIMTASIPDVRHFPLGKDGRAVQFNIPSDGLNMREVAKFVCHQMTLADDFDPFNNPKHAAMFQLVKAEQTGQPSQS